MGGAPPADPVDAGKFLVVADGCGGSVNARSEVYPIAREGSRWPDAGSHWRPDWLPNSMIAGCPREVRRGCAHLGRASASHGRGAGLHM